MAKKVKGKSGARDDEARIKQSKKESRARAKAAEKVRRKAERKAAKAIQLAAEETAQKLVQCARASAENVSRIKAFRSVEGAWDLHSHSVFSDGSKTVDELIAEARVAGLARIAITDHDTLAQLSYVRERSRELGFPVLAGTEVSAHNPATGRKVHILAFGLEATPDGSGPLERLVAQTLFDRTANSLWQAWVLKRAGAEFSGHTVSLDEVVAVAGESKGVYKQHIMEALTRRPQTDPDYRFCYQCLFKGDGVAAHDIASPVAADAVRAVREQGGVPVLAHPGQMDSWDAVPELVEAGLMGIEAFHPDHGPQDTARAFELAGRFGLFVTGGSDYHGKYGDSPAMGTCFVMPDEAGERVEELFRIEKGLR